MKVTAEATRSGDWWAVTVPEVPGAFTQAKRLELVPALVREVVSMLTDVDEADVAVEVRPKTDADDMLAAALAARHAADEAASTASLKMRQAARVLLKDGYTVRDAANLLEVSPQRISQLSKS